ncbi:MAG: twin-arginine translocase TatA/TatE family subunit [Rhodospirillaceae bacterium]|nr:twin-arginine translocase TatA/TatE family subunit [Rhodospirillaceae bacterium]
MGFGSIWHWVIVLVIVLLLFGSGKISNIMGDVAKGIKSFKKGMKDEDDNPPPSAGKTIEGQATAKEKDPVA